MNEYNHCTNTWNKCDFIYSFHRKKDFIRKLIGTLHQLIYSMKRLLLNLNYIVCTSNQQYPKWRPTLFSSPPSTLHLPESLTALILKWTGVSRGWCILRGFSRSLKIPWRILTYTVQVNRAVCESPDGARCRVLFYFRGTESYPAVCRNSKPRQRKDDSQKKMSGDSVSAPQRTTKENFCWWNRKTDWL